MNKKRDEQVIYFKDLLFSTLHQWRKMLLAAIVLALVIGGLSGLSARRAAAPGLVVAQDKQYQDALEVYKKDKENLEQEIQSAQDAISSRVNYLDGSIRMQLDPYRVYIAMVTLYVNTEWEILPSMDYQNPNPRPQILAAYGHYLRSSPVMEDIAQSLGMEERYLRELVTIAEEESGLLKISVMYSDEDGAKQILQQVLSYQADAYAKVRETIGRHTVSQLSYSVNQNISQDLLDTQKRESDRLVELQKSLDIKNERLQKLERPVDPATSRRSVKKSVVTGGVLGVFLGIVLTAVATGFTMVYSDRIYAARNVDGMFPVRILGVVGLPKSNPIDRLLRKWEGREEDSDLRYQLLAANVHNRADGVKTLLISGEAGEAQVERVRDALTLAMPDVRLCVPGDLLRCPQALNALPGCDAVLLVEQCGVSRYSGLDKSLELAADLQKPVLGCVIFE